MNVPYVGQSVERIEDLRLLRGQGSFIDDLSRPNQLHAAILRSPVAHGTITTLDVTAARAMPGVHDIITAAEISHPIPVIPVRLAPLPDLEPFAQPVIAGPRVRYVGEPIAVVIADTPELAEDALELITLEIDSLPAVIGTTQDQWQVADLFDGFSNNIITYQARKGDAWQDFPEAVVFRKTMSVQRHFAATMECRGWLCEWDDTAGHLTCWGATKVPFASRTMLAKMIALPESAIDLIEGDSGGSFGMRGEFYPEDFLIPFAAKRINRPVKWIEDRREHLLTCNHAREFDADIELVCAPDATILAFRGKAFCDLGAYMRANATIAPRNVGQFLVGPYRVPHVHIDTAVIVTNKTPTGTYRGPGRFEADFFRERLLEQAAIHFGLDPVEFRRRNLLTRAEIPSPLPTIFPPLKEEELDSGDYHEALQQCLDLFRWDEKRHLQGQLIDGRYHGLGVACFIEGGAAGPREHARLDLHKDGTITVRVGSSLVGQGLETTMLQIAADALDMKMERLTVLHGSTNIIAQGFGSFHSRSTTMGGAAIIDAAGKLKDRLRSIAGLRLNCPSEEVILQDGIAISPDGASIGWGDLAGSDGMSEDGVFANHQHTYAYGAHAAHVAVDPATGYVDILDYVAVEDVGRMINPRGVRGQLVGSLVQGLGGVFHEHLAYDDQGQMLAGSFVDYILPAVTDFPNIRSLETGNHPTPVGPLGAKGAGEGGVIPAGGTIANAVANALHHVNAQPDHLPLSPARVWQLAGSQEIWL
jgi:aerobic carbon-monoxide dehydrogenase large subunit